MRSVVPRWSAVTPLFLLLTISVGSCSDGVGPVEAGPASRVVKVASGPSHLFGDLTITAANGISYTLLEAEKEVHTSDGQVLVLTEAQFADAQTAFQTVITMDVADSDQRSAAADYYTYCEPGTAYCNQQWMRSDDPKGRTGPRRPHGTRFGRLGQRVLFGDPTPDTARRGRVGMGLLQTVPVLRTSHQEAWEYGGVCDNIAGAILTEHERYRSKRTSFMDHAFEWAVGRWVDGAIKYFLDIDSQGATNFAAAVSSTVNQAIITGYLAGLWTSYNCGNRSVYAGQVFRSTGYYIPPGSPYIGPGPGGTSCYLTQGQITFDGGATWHVVAISICLS